MLKIINKKRSNLFWKNLILLVVIFLSLDVFSQTIKITVDWDKAIREIPSYAYGVNSAANFIPEYSNNSVFMENLELVTQRNSMIRLHGWGMLGDSPESWQENGIWDSEKINAALSPLVAQGYTVMINIPSGPLGEDDYQDSEKFAKFCADLVQIVNVDHQLGIEYWEIPNERESPFSDPGLDINEMANLFLEAASAMKEKDPSIKVGGVATAWVNIGYLTELVEKTFSNIDFITCHAYSGDCSNNIDDAFDIAQLATTDLGILRSQINDITDFYLPIFLTEYNISYQGCPRIQSYEGAVNDAIMLTESIASGIDGTCYWNVAPYSDMSFFDGDEYLEIAHLYEKFNQSFQGNLMESASSDDSKVIIYATSDDSHSAFCLINRTDKVQAISLQFENWNSTTGISGFLIDPDNEFSTVEVDEAKLVDNDFVLTPYSVNLFIGETISSTNYVDQELSFFPNPTTSKIEVPSEFDNKKFRVISAIGMEVSQGKVQEGHINLTGLPKGFYFIHLTENGTNRNVAFKLLKE